MPRLTCSTDELVQTHSLAFVFHVSEKSPSIEQLHEPAQLGMFRDHGPIEPAGFVVLTVGVVVAVLAVPRLVAHENYWDAE